MLSDAVVVGAGPAGAATAILLAREGLSVVLLDRARFPRDKICGEYLSPEGSRILERLGVLARVEARGARPLRGMRIVGPDGTLLVGDYPLDHARSADHPQALAVRRRVLDSALVERAREVGVSVREGMRVVDLLREGTRVTGVIAEPVGPERVGAAAERFSAPLLVAADGRTSVIVERLGLRRPHPWLHRLALVADVEGAGGDPERGEIVLAPPTYSILNPVGAGVGNLSLVIPIEEARRHKGDLAGYFDGVTRALPDSASGSATPGVRGQSGRSGRSATASIRRARMVSSWPAMPPDSSTRSPARASTPPFAPPRSPRRWAPGP